MGKTDYAAKRHAQQSMVLMPLNAPGVNIKRHLPVFGYDDAPHGHMEIELKDVRVNAEEAMLLGEGRGFEIAQGRLGPGRIHHCMRTIGVAEEAISKMAKRLQSRVAFGKKVAEYSIWEHRLARARIDIEMTRLLCLKAADLLPTLSIMSAAFRHNRRFISMSARASPMRCSHTECSMIFLPKAVRDDSRLTIFSSASSATPIVRMQ